MCSIYFRGSITYGTRGLEVEGPDYKAKNTRKGQRLARRLKFV